MIKKIQKKKKASYTLKKSLFFHCRILAAARKAYRVALQNFNNARITCGCVAFTEMIGVDSTCLRVDIQSANRILTHGGWETLVEKDSRNESAPQDAIGLFNCFERAIC